MNSNQQNTTENVSTKFPWQNSQHPISVFIGLHSLSACLALGMTLTNLLLVVTVLRNRRLQTPTNIIVFNIACAGMLQGAVGTVIRILMNYEYDIAKKVIYGAVTSKYICIIRLITSNFPGTFILYMFVVVSVDRYIAIQHP
ncbi:unnamed protein product, partial [Owenia fusiformis]